MYSSREVQKYDFEGKSLLSDGLKRFATAHHVLFKFRGLQKYEVEDKQVTPCNP